MQGRKQITPNFLYSWEFAIPNRNLTVPVSSKSKYFFAFGAHLY
jgi:hypothetical protein